MFAVDVFAPEDTQVIVVDKDTFYYLINGIVYFRNKLVDILNVMPEHYQEEYKNRILDWYSKRPPFSMQNF